MNARTEQHGYSPWPHRVAALLVCITFPLIWVGGLVTTYDAGMAVPDWPSTYGYNLLLYPWDTWVWGPFDLFIEHGHRLLGALAGLVSIALVVTSWACDRRPSIRWAAVGALLLVCGQGALGGARVLLDDRTIALIHGCVGPAFFAYVVVFATVSSRWWYEQAVTELAGGARVVRLALITTLLAYCQLVLGAHLRHADPTSTISLFRVAVYFHIGIAFVLAAHAVVLAVRTTRLTGVKGSPRNRGRLRRPAWGLALLILLQIALGAAVWVLNYGWPFLLSETLRIAGGTVVANSLLQASVTTAHVAMGSLILATSALLAARSLRCFGAPRRAQAEVGMRWEAAR